MKKEPFVFFVFRIILYIAIVFFAAMIYWSSLLVEDNLQELKKDLKSLHYKVDELEGGNLTFTRHKNIYSSDRPHIKEELPNILTTDRFYQSTLPHMLGEGFSPSETRTVALLSKPEHLHPFSGMAVTSQLIDYCVPNLATLHLGKYETATPVLAEKIERREGKGGGYEFWVHLRKGVVWQPLKQDYFSDITLSEHFLKPHPVTAYDFEFYVDILQNKHFQEPGAVSARNYYGDLEEIEVIDDFTFVVRWKTKDFPDGSKRIKYTAQQLTGNLQPLPSFVYKYYPDGTKIVENDHPETYREHAVFAQQFAKHWAKHVIVSIGPYIFDGMTDRMVKFRRNRDYFNPYAALSREIHVVFRETPESMWQDFKSGVLDTYGISANKLSEFKNFLESKEYLAQKEKGEGIQRLDYLNNAFFYVGWNFKKEIFESKEIRKALTLAIDRKRIVELFLLGMGEEITGPSFKDSPSYNKKIKPLPYDPIQARDILLANGWYDRDGDGILDKEIDGKNVPFRFELVYYVKNPETKIQVEYIQTALKEIGIDCLPKGVDIADLTNKFEDKDFDAIYFGWGLGTPPENHRQIWHSAGANEKGSSNAIGFANTEVDQIIDALDFEFDLDKRNKLYWRFHEILYDEMPYTFIYSPKVTYLYRDYVKGVFIPKERQDLIPGANIPEPDSRTFWIEKKKGRVVATN